MKNNSKRILALLLAVVMCIGCVVPVFAEADADTGAEDSVVITKENCPHKADDEGNHLYTEGAEHLVFIKTVPAECGKTGFDLWECKECGAPVATNWQNPDEASHKFGDWTDVEGKAPTCAAPGEQFRVCLNENCGKTETQTIQLPHTYVGEKPTIEHCYEGIPAWTETCSACGDVKEHEAEAGHPCDSRYVAEIVKKPTCFETGLAIVKCEDCSFESLEVVINKTNGGLGHTWVKDGDFTAAPTCGGYGSGNAKCSACGATAKVENGKIVVEVQVADVATAPIDVYVSDFAPTGIHDFIVDVAAKESTCSEFGCVEHKKCANCDATSIDGTNEADVTVPKKAHAWEKVNAKDADCADEKAGCIAHFECSACLAVGLEENGVIVEKKLEDVQIAPKHSFDLSGKPVAIVDATCTEYGFWFYGCKVCGKLGDPSNKEDADFIGKVEENGGEWVAIGVLRFPKESHDLKYVSDVEAGDCVNAKVELWACENCSYTEEKTLDVPGHNWETVEIVADCQDGGYKYDICKGCNTVRVETEVPTLSGLPATDANGFYYVTDPNPEFHKETELVQIFRVPTCTESGWGYYRCVKCEDVWHGPIDKLAHDFATEVDVKVYEPKCGVAGYTAKILACACGEKTEVKVEGSDVPALKHEYSGTVVSTPAKCGVDASDKVYCIHNCGTYETKTYVGTALEHNYEKNDALSVVPSCKDKKAGYDYTVCSNCGDIVKVTVEFALENPAHHAEAKYQGVLREGSCEKSKIDAWYCESCDIGFVVEDDSMVGDHKEVAGSMVDAIPSDCINAGTYAHFVCSKCPNKVYINDNGDYVVYENDSELVDPADGHVCDEATFVEGVAPSCEITGIFAHYICGDCGKYIAADKVTILDSIVAPAAGHSWNAVEAKAHTCSEDGYVAHFECANCDAVSLDGENVAPIEDVVIPAANHVGYTVDGKLLEADCLNDGYQYHFCVLCNAEWVDKYVYAYGHSFGEKVEAEAKCGTVGYIAHFYCSRCDGYYLTDDVSSDDKKTLADVTIPATGEHKNAAGETISAACTGAAVEDRHCVLCDTDIVISHSNLVSNDVDATCQEYGYTAHYCGDCGYYEVIKKAEFKPTNPDHKIVDDTTFAWVVVKEATQFTTGEKQRQCVSCGYSVESAVIPAEGGIAFSYVIDNAIVSGAEYVNGGKIKLTIKYIAADADLSNIAIRLNYNADVLEFVSGDFACDVKDADGNRIFDINNAAIGGKTAGFVVVTAKTYGFGEQPVDKKVTGEGIFAEIYFNINKSVDDGAEIGFSVDTDSDLSKSMVLKADGSEVNAEFGSIESKYTVSLGDIDIDNEYNAADEREFLDIAFGNSYIAAADINQDGLIGSDDYALLLDLLLGNIDYAKMCEAAQSK